MKNNIKKWYIVGTLFIIVFGVLLHFLYEWSGNNSFVGLFSAVNESTWEHLKLLFWPSFFFSIIEYIFIGKDYNNYITAKAVSFYSGILLIIILFYTYTGIVGDNFIVMDILIFIVSVVISQFIGYKITVCNGNVNEIINIISFVAIVLLALAFIFFTVNPPQIPLFKDPVTGGYGIVS
ncbi:hypothetical protein SH2C18_30970 [Clostridium sediminicola]|uniref:DUF6512 family protein n=1 Tax=Clostridium sediminicola TaxID=3114879 RepID=UPI0031F261E7